MSEAGGPTQGLKLPLSYPEREIINTAISLSLSSTFIGEK